MANRSPSSAVKTGTDKMTPSERRALRAVELMFFAYRDFTSDPDAILEPSGLGRAHHRVVHFVGREPGMTVSELLEVLRITKQSLNRVLQQLLAEGYIRQQPGARDRRQRCLFLTRSGERFWSELRAPQIERFGRAFRKAGPEAAAGFEAVLAELLDVEGQEEVLGRLSR